MNLKPWPLAAPTEESGAPLSVPAPIRKMSDVERAFPVSVSPSVIACPEEYFANEKKRNQNTDNPWVILSDAIIFEEVSAPWVRLLPRGGSDPEMAWNQVLCMISSFEHRVEIKIALVAWVLETAFVAYWVEDSPPDWVIALEEEDV